MRKTLFIIFFVVHAFYLNAQQIGMYGHSFYKPILYNPALTGSNGFINATVISRMQWTGFTNSPQLNVFNLDGNFKNKNVGLGVGFISDRKGISNRMGGNLAYSYRLKLNKEASLFLGVSVGLINQSHDFSKLVGATTDDPVVFGEKQSQLSYDANAGFAFRWKALELGASSPQVVGNKISYKSDSSAAMYQQVRHYMAYLQYKFLLNEEKGISVIPNMLTRIVPNSPLQYDGTITFSWEDLFWLGATYKSEYAVAANAGFCIKKRFYVGYSYDFIIGSISKYAGMSHEIMLNFKFGNKKEEPIEEISEERNIIEKEQKIVEVVEEEIAETQEEESQPLPDLNTLLIRNIIKEIETTLDNPNATSAQILDLKMRISAFSNSDFEDASMKAVVQNVTSMLKFPEEKNPDIIVKGNIILEGASEPVDYGMVSITIIDSQTDETVGTYLANSKTGKFLLILRPGNPYQLIIENDGYDIYMEDISFEENLENQELNKEIVLKKE